MNPELRSLIALQDTDQKISSLKKQIADIPEKINSYRDELHRLEQAHQEKGVTAQELTKQRRAREGEVEAMRSKLARLRDQLMAVKTNKEYTAMIHEIQMAEDQIRSAEDGILELMEQIEAMESELALAETELRSRKSELEDQIRKAEDLVPQLEGEGKTLEAEKADLECRIAPDLLARYHRIAEARKGIALAEARDELCSACHVRIRPQVFADLHRTDELYVCDSCSRILFIREGASLLS